MAPANRGCAACTLLVCLWAGAAAADETASRMPSRAATGIYVLGPTRLVAGTRASFRVSTHWASSPTASGPLSATVELRLARGRRGGSVLARQTTDARGDAQLAFRVPALSPGTHSLVVSARSPLGRAEERREVELVLGGRVLLTTDKPLYQPGQTIHLRSLAMRSVDGQPLARRPVRLTVLDPRDNRVFVETRRSSAYGVASADFTLADEVNLGRYTIVAEVEGDGEMGEARKTVKVRRYTLPRFEATVQTDRRAYRPGDLLRGTVRARYVFGKPVSGARIALDIRPELCGRISDTWRCKRESHAFRLTGDGRGEARFSLELPRCKLLAPCTNGEVRIHASVTDAAGRHRRAEAAVPLSQLHLRLAIAVAGGELVPGMKNAVHVVATTLDGRPVRRGTVYLRSAGAEQRAVIDGLGTATFEVVPQRDGRCAERGWRRWRPSLEQMELRAAVEDYSGNAGEVRRCVPVAREPLMVQPRYSLVPRGYPLVVELRAARAAEGEVAALEVIKEAQALVSQTSTFHQGVARFVVRPDRRVAGLLALRGSRLLAPGQRVSHRRAVYVEPPVQLDVTARLDRASYRPGDSARLELLVRQGGAPVQAALGVHAIDKAVLLLAEHGQDDPALYFNLADYALGQAGRLEVQPGGRGLAAWLGDDHRWRQRAAEVLLSVVAPPDIEAWETNPWAARQEEWDRRSAKLVEEARRAVSDLVVGQRTASGWDFHPRLVAILAAAKRVPASHVRDPWQREVRPKDLVAVDSTLSFAKLADEAAPQKLEQLYELLRKHERQLGLRRDRSPHWPGTRGLVILPPDILARVQRLPGVRGAITRDPWGQLFRVRYNRNEILDAYHSCGEFISRHEIYSVGADGRPGHGDDIVPPGDRQEVPRGPLGTISIACYGYGYGMLSSRRARSPSIVMGNAMVRGGSMPGAPLREAVRTRSRFPETLLWRPEVITDRGGRAVIDVPLADSITTWRIFASASSADGLHGRTALDLRAFQPFFVDVDLPATLTVGDRIHLPVSIYNYLKVPQRVSLRLELGDGLAALGARTQELTLAPSQVAVRHFPLEARRIGEQLATVHAAATSTSGEVARDTVERRARVEPDGSERARSFAGVLDGAASHTMTIPEHAIAGTTRVQLAIHPGPLSQTLDGLEGLLQMPDGCFEQTSSTLYPNVLVLDYLRQTRKATPALEAQARRFIGAGYQRLLTFEVPGGGFSWFGKAPANLVLTAYGVMEFTDMGRVHPVDQRLVARTRRWLIDKQAADGSWGPDKRYYLDGVVNHLTRDRLRITAYVAHALAYSGYRGPALQRGLAYVKAHLTEARDAYTLALAGNLLGRAREAGQVSTLDRLWKLRRTGEHVYFDGPGATVMHGAGRGGDVETTALATLAFLEARGQVQRITPLVAALVASKDSAGSWHSTQATILSLRALLAYQRTTTAPPRGTLEVAVNGLAPTLVRLDGQDRVHHLDLASIAAPGSHRVALRFRGTGRAQYQLVGRYWEPHRASPTAGALSIATRVDRSSVRRGDPVRLAVRVANRAGRAVPMPLVSVALPPGLELDPEELERLAKTAGVDKVQQRGNQALLYLEELSARGEVRFELRLGSRYPLDVQARPSTIYEYYQPENRAESRPQRVRVL